MAMQLKERAARNGHAADLDLRPAPAANRRRLPEIATGMLVIAVCAIAALWWQSSATETEQVLALRHAIERGHVLERSDLKVVGIDAEGDVSMLAGTESVVVVGQVARSDLPAGALVVAEQFSQGSLLAAGSGVVGLALEPGEFPTLSLSVGDNVAVVLTPAAGDPRAFDEGADASVLGDAATVVEVSAVGVQGRLFVSIEVGESDAARIAAAASANRVRLIQVPGEGS